MDPSHLDRQSEAGGKTSRSGARAAARSDDPLVQVEPDSALAIGPDELRNRTLSQPVDHGERSSEDMRKTPNPSRPHDAAKGRPFNNPDMQTKRSVAQIHGFPGFVPPLEMQPKQWYR